MSRSNGEKFDDIFTIIFIVAYFAVMFFGLICYLVG